MFLFGIVPSPFTGDEGGQQGGGQQPGPPPAASPSGNLAERCKTGADADQSEDCRVVGTVNSIQSYWRQAFQERGRKQYTPAKTVLFSQAVDTGCGAADSAVGPFLLPGRSQGLPRPDVLRHAPARLRGRGRSVRAGVRDRPRVRPPRPEPPRHHEQGRPR
ncbi:hypothetical protein GCM10020220_104480 [Nonomuraea rubra]